MGTHVKREQKLVQEINATVVSDKKLALAPLLRAGNDILDFIPSARLDFTGFYRDEVTLKSVKCYLT
ncbi:MAG: uracil phosphoribosyltransferase [Pseudohongiellaceae bacterium]